MAQGGASLKGMLSRRARSDRGATLVEYALGLSLFVLVISASATVLGDAGSSEVDNQAMCVSERPPPPECLVRTVTTTTTVPTGPGGPSTTVVTPPGPPPAVPTTAQWSDQTVTGAPGDWRAQATIGLNLTDDGTPLEGAQVRVRVTLTDPPSGTVFFLTCTTDAAGRCNVSFDVRDPLRNGIAFVLDDVTPGASQSLEDPIEVVDVSDPGPVPFTAPA